MRTPIIGGNWKMNTDKAGAVALAKAVAQAAGALPASGAQTIVFPPFPYLDAVHAALGGSPRVSLGAQDCYHAEKGAFTGEVSPLMLKDVGCAWVLAGHSERRHVLHEGDDMVNMKLRSALAAGLGVVLCVGEKLEQRLTGQTDTVNERQVERGLRDVPAEHLARIVIAYEPVWAIGTGKVATPQDAQAAHKHIRGVVANLFGPDAASAMRIQYGGSVTAASAAGLFAEPDIDGFLVGGASLKPDEFAQILRAAPAPKG
jgi:triosephosphate isomerase